MDDEQMFELFGSIERAASIDVIEDPSDIALAIIAVAAGLFTIAESVNSLRASIDRLGLSNAATPKGAIEVLSEEIKNGLNNLASAVENSRQMSRK